MSNLRSALALSFKELFPELVSPKELIKWENKAFTPPSGTQLWANFFYTEVSRNFIDSVEDEVRGYIQIDFNVPQNTGDGVLNAAISRCSDRYKPGFAPDFNGEAPMVQRSAPTGGRSVDVWFRRSITVYFMARIVREISTPAPEMVLWDNDQPMAF